MPLPVVYDLDIYQGDTIENYFRIRGKTASGQPGPYINLTGTTPKAEIRVNESSAIVMATFTCALDDQTVSPGGVTLKLSHAQTLTISNGVWDLQFINSLGEVRTYLRGSVTVYKEVTRSA